MMSSGGGFFPSNVGSSIPDPWNGPGDGTWNVNTDVTFANSDSDVVCEIGTSTIQNLEFPATAQTVIVRYAQRWYPIVLDGNNESTACYCRVDPVATHGLHPWWMYLEISDNQTDGDAGGGIKCIHCGHGDAFFCVLCGTNAVGYEAATFVDGTRGFIGTIQTSGLPNSVPFTGLWEQSTKPNFAGCLLAEEQVCNAITIQKIDGGIVAPADGDLQLRLVEHDYATTRFGVYNDGATLLRSLDSSAGTTTRHAPLLTLAGTYWNGAANVECHAQIWQQVTATTPTSELRFYMGDSGSETLEMILHGPGGASANSLDLQNHNLINVNSIAMYASGSGIDVQNTAISNVGSLAFYGSGTGIDMQATNIANCGSITMYGASHPLDLQNNHINNCGDFDHNGTNLGFFTTAPTTKQTVAGAKGGNAALTNLLTALAAYGLLTDSTT